LQPDRLWAPWRLEYITGETQPDDEPDAALDFRPGADRECFLCRGVASTDDRLHLVAHRGEHSFVVLNRYPYNNGHLLISPLKHKSDLTDLSAEEHSEISQTLTLLTKLLRSEMNAQGFNIGLNLGATAGAGVLGHLHWHIVPRWAGDTNYMGSVAGCRVIPQALDTLWELLRNTWPQATGERTL